MFFVYPYYIVILNGADFVILNEADFVILNGAVRRSEGSGASDSSGSPGKVCVLDFVASDGLMPRTQRRSTDREHQLFVIH